MYILIINVCLMFMQIEEMGGSALVVGGDMSKEADVSALFKAVSFWNPLFPGRESSHCKHLDKHVLSQVFVCSTFLR